MNLLIFTPYYPPHIGGLESHAEEFNKHLANENFIITVFSPRLPKDAPDKQIDNKYLTIIRYPAWEIIPNYSLPKFWSLKFWRLFCNLYKQHFDITISRTRFFFSSFMALIFAKTKRTKFIHIEHGSDFVQLSSKFKNFVAKSYDYTFGWLIFKFSDINISISKAVQKFVYKFNKRPSPIIYRGLNTKEIDNINIDTAIQHKYNNKTIITFIGRLYKWKGVENSIKAVKNLPTKLKKDIIFIVVGNGEDFEHLKKIVGDETAIIFTGNVPRDKAISILKSSQIYIHSAYPGGGLSTSLLEAMYCHNAIIATPHEGAKEVLKNNKNGILINKSDYRLITKSILTLVRNKSLIHHLSKEAKQTIVKEISWQKSIKKYEKEFKKILAKK